MGVAAPRQAAHNENLIAGSVVILARSQLAILDRPFACAPGVVVEQAAVNPDKPIAK